VAPGPFRAEQVGPTWAGFLRSQAEAILPTDFFTVTLLNGATVYVLAIIEHASQRVRILGVTAHPDNRWVTPMARNLIMEVGEHAEAVTVLIRDRDTKFTAAFDRMFADAGLKILRSPVRAPGEPTEPPLPVFRSSRPFPIRERAFCVPGSRKPGRGRRGGAAGYRQHARRQRTR